MAQGSMKGNKKSFHASPNIKDWFPAIRVLQNTIDIDTIIVQLINTTNFDGYDSNFSENVTIE